MVIDGGGGSGGGGCVSGGSRPKWHIRFGVLNSMIGNIASISPLRMP